MKVYTYNLLFHIHIRVTKLYQHIVKLLLFCYLHSFFLKLFYREKFWIFFINVDKQQIYVRKPKVPLIRDSSLRVSSNKFFFLLLCCCFFTHHTQLLDAISPLTYILRLYIFPQNNTSASLAMGKVFSSLYLKTRQLQQQISMNFIQGHEAAIFIFISWYFHSFSTWDFLYENFSTHNQNF